MHNKNILVTGGAGFIGSNFIKYFCKKYPNYNIINLDKLTYAGSLDNIVDIPKGNHVFVKGCICDKSFINKLFIEYKFQGIIHFAAESHVDNSINSPDEFIETNVIGTFNLIDAAKNLWMESPHHPLDEFRNARFHHISTDEVYGSLEEVGLFTESTPYAPNSPYSASKASSDFLVRAYNKTYGLNTTISNCSNNYGAKQHSEKLIPKTILNILQGIEIPVYGTGNNVRDWLYVEDHVEAIDLIFHEGIPGETYNIGGNCEKTTLEIVHILCDIMDYQKPNAEIGSYRTLIKMVSDRPGHDFRYAIDASKIKTSLGWHPKYTFENAIGKTVKRFLANGS